MTKKILFLTNIPSPYMVNFFNELGAKTELTVLFEKNKSDSRDISWTKNMFINFEGIILNGIKTDSDKALSISSLKYLKKDKYDAIIVSNPLTPTGIISIIFMWLKKIPFIIESEGGFPKNGKSLKEKFKKFILSKANLYFSTSETGDNYFLKYGAKQEIIKRYPFTSIYDNYILNEPLESNKKKELKNIYGLLNLPTVLTVGSFVKLKRIEDLIIAFSKLNIDSQLLIIGGGILEKKYQNLIKELNLKNVKIIDFLLPKELESYFMMSDLFVFPTESDCWGLVVNEAMAKGLPIVSSNMSIAAEVLVKVDKNGKICNVGDIDCYVESIESILKNKNLATQMGNYSIKKVREFTFEKMVESHLENINIYLNKINAK